MLDPRPHVGEPLALDLLNTRWMSADGPQDLLTDLAGLCIWLETNGLGDCTPADEKMRRAVISARDAVHRAVIDGSADEINAVLARGHILRSLEPEGPVDVPDVSRAEWLPGWLAAANLLDLLAQSPERIKQCAHPHCVLFFYDTSKNGARRWHSMATCGNRVKAARHYAKQD